MCGKVKVRKKAYFLDAGYVVRQGRTYVKLLLKGRKTIRRYYQYDPYFLADAPPEKKDSLLNVTALKPGAGIIRPLRIEEIVRKTGQERKQLLKIVCSEPSHVPLLKAAMPFQCFESGIPFSRRVVFDMRLVPFSLLHYEREGSLIKKIILVEDASPRLHALAFDIETYNPVGAPREEKDPVIMISYSGTEKGVLSWKSCGTCPGGQMNCYKTLEDERSMLQEFGRVIEKEDPDVLLGYNSANFDLPYIQARSEANKAGLRMGRWSPRMKKVKRGLINGIALDGRIHIDIYPLVRFFGFIGVLKTTRFTLDAIAEELLGKRKVGVRKEDIWKLWDSGDIGLLAEYCLRDAELAAELGKKLLPLEIELSIITKIPLYDISLSTSGQMVENLLMYSASKEDYLLPSKPTEQAIAQRLANPIQGAFVKLPEPGIYENIAVLDFRGLYPTIIVSYNIDPGTLVRPEAGKESSGMEKGERGTHLSPSGARFLKAPVGLVPSVLDWLIDFRAGLKRELKRLDSGSGEHVVLSARVQAIKILTNSFFGYLGYARSRWYSRECAESITAWGRQHILETIEKAEKAGFRVLYGDTDSVVVIYKCKEEVFDFIKQVNASLPEKMELELEGFYPRGVFVGKKGEKEVRGAKKKYALLGEDGRTKIRGFELVRRDWSQIAKSTQKRVLEAILREGSREAAASLVRETIKRLQGGAVPLEELAISTQLKKEPENYDIISPEVSAVRKAMRQGRRFEKGSIIQYVITKSGKSISEKAELLELARNYDADYYINNQVLPSVMKILKELGYDEYSLKVGGRQQSLGGFL